MTERIEEYTPKDYKEAAERLAGELNNASDLIQQLTDALNNSNAVIDVFKAKIQELEQEKQTIKRGFDELLRLNKVGVK